MRFVSHKESTPSCSICLHCHFLHFREPPWEEKVDYGLKIMNNQEFFCKGRIRISIVSGFWSVYELGLSCFWHASSVTAYGRWGDALNMCYPQNRCPSGPVIMCARNTRLHVVHVVHEDYGLFSGCGL
jgi:hypothetical protein